MNHEQWCHEKIEMLEEVINKCRSYHNNMTHQAIEAVRDSGKYDDSMFENIEE